MQTSTIPAKRAQGNLAIMYTPHALQIKALSLPDLKAANCYWMVRCYDSIRKSMTVP